MFRPLRTYGLEVDAIESLEVDQDDRIEAFRWLSTNQNGCALAGQRFRTTQEARQFIAYVYYLGADNVHLNLTRIYDEEWRIGANGGPYTDEILVKLPEDPERRQLLFALANDELRWGMGEDDEETEISDNGEKYLRFWWD